MLTKIRKLSAASSAQGRLQHTDYMGKSINLEWTMSQLTRLIRCTRAATAIEYALIASLISIACIGAMVSMGNKIDTMFNNVSNHLG
jgi:pilus assembly protein Flp/PilA